MRLVTQALIALLALVQGELWFGKGGVTRVVDYRSRLAEQTAKNAVLRVRNERLDAEVRDLRNGIEMVEEKARLDLGMIKPDEIYVQVSSQP